MKKSLLLTTALVSLAMAHTVHAEAIRIENQDTVLNDLNDTLSGDSITITGGTLTVSGGGGEKSYFRWRY